jgi:hypothetical protein
MTPDVSHIKNLDVTHETSDVNVPGVAKFVLGLTVMGVFVFVLVWAIFGLLSKQEEEKAPKPGPMAMSPQERLPPDPRLQAAPGFGVKLENGEWVPLEKREPQAEYRVLREQWERDLKCPGDQKFIVNFSSRDLEFTKCVPIDRAMQRVVEVGLPSRKQDNAVTSIDDYGVSRPTAASSGRMTEKGKQ